MDKAVDLFYINKFADAAELFQEVIDLEPETKISYWYLGLCYLLQGEPDEAQMTWWLTIDESYPSTKELTGFLGNVAREFGLRLNRLDIATDILRVAVDLEPESLDLLRDLSRFLLFDSKHSECIATAEVYSQLSDNLADQIFANFLIQNALLKDGNDWTRIFEVGHLQIDFIQNLVKTHSKILPNSLVNRLYSSTFFLSYVRDEPLKNRTIQNQLSQFCAETLTRELESYVHTKSTTLEDRPLKIGYLSHCLRSHSVGWLARWIFQHHDREQFKIYGYFVADKPDIDAIRDKIASHCDQVYQMGFEAEVIAKQINDDDIDILVDLDSNTLDLSCQVMALKPAPIQVTWLGMDASGVPSIDYFIADPYVLPDHAQDYYAEKIWRLPNTYIAVDGFEVLFPTIHRSLLDIPEGAIVYFTSQSGYKRHPDTIKLQLQIIKAVPHSFLIIKGTANQETLKTLFYEIGEEVGLDRDRLRFLPMTKGVLEHRANLDIADVVLDTYPYNGATTTMETLWMCIPMVTKVGQQFAARNSYTMMMNAGITEGIAWTDKEYVEWGIRLGRDENLRKQVFWKLKESRKSSPLWDAKQFTKDMENAYQQMWKIYCHS
ncbi:putative O-linked N-acetylglucosamine transferase, SPINDLY family [Synechococcus sp. PCC 7502]|uniref:O-linked N-acetylglucosamine transferase, SPINDLY family protein n=1 Tax=Synechococcus sp. PCC 7502 TaxID=1173263 RepID=UPI00029F82B3|nr:tetratricopeptide repeat protein [Synechococcus sp. PCC 7502]AFY73050.1 putative O-linked N-acetylglucosamine transferase, SPINDLY family [Synechococcus sp. PCC 7502]